MVRVLIRNYDDEQQILLGIDGNETSGAIHPFSCSTHVLLASRAQPSPICKLQGLLLLLVFGLPCIKG